MDKGDWWAAVHGIAESNMTEQLILLTKIKKKKSKGRNNIEKSNKYNCSGNMPQTGATFHLKVGGFGEAAQGSLQVVWQSFPWLMPERPASTQLRFPFIQSPQ